MKKEIENTAPGLEGEKTNKEKESIAPWQKDMKSKKPEKRINKTWEAFHKWKGAFTIIDPTFLQ